MSTKTQVVPCTKTFRSPLPAPIVPHKDIWRKDWKTDAAASSNTTQPIQLKRRDQLAGTGRPVILKNRVEFDQENASQHVRKDNVQCDQRSTGRPVACDVGTRDFRIQGLSYSRVEQAEYVRVRELINWLESHSHRDAEQADLMQDNVHNPSRENSKKMIHDVESVEYFELCEITSKVQCSYCLSYWAKGIVYCACGICLCQTEAMRRLNRKRFDTLSFRIT